MVSWFFCAQFLPWCETTSTCGYFLLPIWIRSVVCIHLTREKAGRIPLSSGCHGVCESSIEWDSSRWLALALRLRAMAALFGSGRLTPILQSPDVVYNKFDS